MCSPVLPLGVCRYSVVYDALVDITDGYRSQGGRLHILASSDLWTLPKGRGCLVPNGSHVLWKAIRSTLQGETLNIQASVEGGDLIRVAIAHIDNLLRFNGVKGRKPTTRDLESKATSSMRHVWLTDCDSTASSLHNTAKPVVQDQRPN